MQLLFSSLPLVPSPWCIDPISLRRQTPPKSSIQQCILTLVYESVLSKLYQLQLHCPLLNAILDCKPVLSEWYQLLKEAASVHVTVAWISRYLINEARGAFANLWWWEFPPLKYSGQPDEKCQQLPKWRWRGVFVQTAFWNLCPVWIWPPHSVRSGQRHRTQNQTQQTNTQDRDRNTAKNKEPHAGQMY